MYSARGARAAPHGAAPPVKQSQADAMTPERLDELDKRLEQFPARREVAAVLVAVGVTEHHFLGGTARGEHTRIHRDRHQLVHHPRRPTQMEIA
jgi:hypothetical protein